MSRSAGAEGDALGGHDTAAAPKPAAEAKPAAKSRLPIWLAAGLGGVAVHLVLWQISEPSALFSDFFKANWEAAAHLWEDGWNATFPLTEKGGFSQLPSLGWLYVPFLALGESWAGWGWTALGLAALLAAWALLVRLARLEPPLAAALLFCFLANGPAVNSLREGQTSHIMLFLLVAGLALWRRRREFLAGLAFGLCAAIKLPLLFLGVYFLYRRRWRIAAGGGAAVGLVVLTSAAQFGFGSLVAWYQEWVAPYLSGYIPAFNVQSIDGFLLRLEKGEAFMIHWDPPFAPSLFHRIARAVALIALFGTTMWLIWRGARLAPTAGAEPSPRELVEFALVIALGLLTSPISWTHYYVYLLIPWALYLGRQLPLSDDVATRWLMRLGYLGASMPIVMWATTEPSWYNAVLSRTVVSVCLIGGLSMFVALARGTWRADRRAPLSQSSLP